MDIDDTILSLNDSRFISNVLYRVKSGKEADVYCCEAQPTAGAKLLAAKIYRPLEERSFKNDKIYQEGRYIEDARLRRAYSKKTSIGRKQQFYGWINAEYETLNVLYCAGAHVPKPYGTIDNAIVMEYIGDEEQPAPTLNRARLSAGEAQNIYGQIIGEIKLWFMNKRIHSDLSAYNILYWNGKITAIDFPQAVDPDRNANSFNLLLRDIENITDYFRKYNVICDPPLIASSIWDDR